jgi:hypothetical protein
MAERAGLKAVAVTDHDCVDGVGSAVTEGERLGIEVISGVEMSVSTFGKDVHLLGYFIDPGDKALCRHLDFFKETRVERAREIIARLEGLGLVLDPSKVISDCGPGSIGRMHIAKALVGEGLCPDIDTAFQLYLRDGGPAFVEKYRIPANRAVEVIHRSGGIAFLAHPGFYNDETLISSLFEAGMDGLEVYNPSHSDLQVYNFRAIVREQGGLESGGSDFHGCRERSLPLGAFKVPYSIVARMSDSRSAPRTSEGLRHDVNESR